MFSEDEALYSVSSLFHSSLIMSKAVSRLSESYSLTIPKSRKNLVIFCFSTEFNSPYSSISGFSPSFSYKRFFSLIWIFSSFILSDIAFSLSISPLILNSIIFLCVFTISASFALNCASSEGNCFNISFAPVMPGTRE